MKCMNYEKNLIITCEFMAAKVLLFLCATTIVVELCLADEQDAVQNTSVEVEFAKEPEDSITGYGQHVVLTCQVNVKTKKLVKTTYQWKFNNEILTKNFKPSGNYTVSATAAKKRQKEEGGYYCIANTTYGMLKSRSAQVKLAEISLPPPDKLESVTITAFEGESARLTCDLISVPEAEFSWKTKSQQITKGTEKYLISSKYLYINNVQQKDAGEYSCEGRNSQAERQVTTLSMVLKVEPFSSSSELKFISPEPPANIPVVRGKNLSLHCHVNKANAEVKWAQIRKENRGGVITVPSDSKKNYFTLEFGPVKENEYQYACMANLPNNESKIETRTVDIFVGDAPKITQIVASQVVSMIGVPVRLHCNVTGLPTPKVTWYRNGEEILSNKDHRINLKSMAVSSGRSHSLGVTAVGSVDRGVYQCVAENQFGTTSKATVLEVMPIAQMPSPVTNLQCLPISTTEIMLKFNYSVDPDSPAITYNENSNGIFGHENKDDSKLDSPNMIPNVFLITYYREDNVSDAQTESTINNNGSITISRLRPNTKYTFSIRRYNGRQGSELSQLEMCSTLGGANSILHYERIFWETVLIWWSKVWDESYTVDVKLDGILVYRKVVDESFVVLRNLTLGRRYEVKVSSKKGSYEPKTITLATVDSTSEEYVFQIYKVNDSSAVFMWTMAYSEFNSLQGFVIRYKKLKSQNEIKKLLYPNETSCIVENLSPRDSYEVSLSLIVLFVDVNTTVEVHKTVYNMSVQMPTERLSPPGSFECKSTGPSGILFLWYYPYPIEGAMYIAKLRKRNSHDKFFTITKGPKADRNYLFDGLLPDTEYEMSARIFSKDGRNSDYADFIFCKTDTSNAETESPRPGKVIDISYKQKDATTLSLSWEKSKVFNELEDQFVILYKNLNKTSDPETIELPGSSTSTLISNLDAGSTYEITIRTENPKSGYENDSEKKFIKLNEFNEREASNEREEPNEALIGVTIGITIGVMFILCCIISAFFGKRFLKKYYYERNDSMRALSTFKKPENISAKNSTVFKNSATYSNGTNLQLPLLRNGSYFNAGVQFNNIDGVRYCAGASTRPVRYENDMLLNCESPVDETFQTVTEITDTERDNEGGDSGYCDKNHSQSPSTKDCTAKRQRKSSDTATDEGFHDANMVSLNGNSPV